MKLFISTDYQFLDSRLMEVINLEFFNNHIEEVITTTSALDEIIRKICVAKGVEFKLFDMDFTRDPQAIELLVKDVDKFCILSKLHNTFYLNLFKANESWIELPDGNKYKYKEVKSVLKNNYRESISQGGNISSSFDSEVTDKLRKFQPSKFIVYSKDNLIK